jgi:hypothetical protein
VGGKYAVRHQVGDGTFHEARREAIMSRAGHDNPLHRGRRRNGARSS